MKPMNDQATEIKGNLKIADEVWRLRFPVDWATYDPGQFVMLSIPGTVTFLRRPFGIAHLKGGLAEICYKVVGKGTRALSQAPVGTAINVLGPCGRGYALPVKSETAVLVAGGYGIAPLCGLAHHLRQDKRTVRLYYGGKRKGDLFCLDELRQMGVDLRLTTEDGSIGEKGLVTGLLERELSSIEKPALFACGPKGLVEAVAGLGLASNLPTQVSMDTYMACGLGVCLGCVCQNAEGEYVRVCREGPVFEARELDWSALR
jgi:dihydroorotate dehydrogenase electron transfer subunit